MTRNIPDTEHSSVARFLESQGLKEEALAVTKDSDQKFDLALELEKLDIAHELMTQLKETDKDTTEANSKWKRLGDLALSRGNLELSEKCAEASGDMAGLLLLYTSTGNYEGTVQLCEKVRSGSLIFICGRMNQRSHLFFFSLSLHNRQKQQEKITSRSSPCSFSGASRIA